MKSFHIIKTVLLFACTAFIQSSDGSAPQIDSLHQRALSLLAKYNLHPADTSPVYREPQIKSSFSVERTVVFDTTEFESNHQKRLVFNFIQAASENIGLRPTQYLGRSLVRLNYLLQDKTQSESQISAHVFFCDTNIAAAHLSLHRYFGGLISLNNRSAFKPKDFVFPLFKADLLDTVTICGPWDKSERHCGWLNRVELLSQTEKNYFTGIFSGGTKVDDQLDYHFDDPGEEYAAVIRFKTGESYFPHFVFRNDSAFLNDYNCYYLLDTGFIDFIEGTVAARGVPTCIERKKRK